MRISVRALVEYVFSSGSIDAKFRSQSTLTEGTRLHQKIQKTYGEGDEKELSLKMELPLGELTLIIEGRCDGLLHRDGEIIVDEIKTFTHLSEQEEQDGYPVHWAQAKMYAYIYGTDHNLNEITVQLTYVSVETEEKRYLKKRFTLFELKSFVDGVINAYVPYVTLLFHHQQNRNNSIKELEFPFKEYRAGQRKLAAAVYKTILDKKTLFAVAPTGIGKTISTLFPSVKAIGEGHLKRIFYLTAKTITRSTAEEAFRRMRESGLHLKAVTITAKDKVCFKAEPICEKDACEFAHGYYDRINEAVLDILSCEESLTRETIEVYARKHCICPFEFSLDLAYAVDAVICDYNYIFDPRISLKRLYEEQKRTTVLLIDEAHNLVERGREMFSATLNKELFLQLKKIVKGIHRELYRLANQLNSHFISLKKANPDKKEMIFNELEEEFFSLLHDFENAASQNIMEGKLEPDVQKQLLDAYFSVQKFLRIKEQLDDHYVIYGETNHNDLMIKLFCLDPSKLLHNIGKGFRSKVFFSATLTPIPYYRDILGGKKEDFSITVPSPFSEKQVDVFIKPVSTRYRERDRTKGSIVKLLHDLIKERPGNYLTFFPSYQYLLDVFEEYKKLDIGTDTIVQVYGMTELEREAFLQAFEPNRKKTLLGFAVLGGIFSEGVDLIGDRLNGVVVVGVGLPQLCFERNLMLTHFDKNGRNGYEYAYVYPGMNKVLQAGGRLIRSETDFGTIVLVDDRFLQQPYQSLLPQEWQTYTII